MDNEENIGICNEYHPIQIDLGNNGIGGYFVLKKHNMGNQIFSVAYGKDLSELVRDVTATVSASQEGSKSDGQFFDLPLDFLYTIQEEASITSADPCYGPATGVEIKPVTHDMYTKNRKNPHKKPYEELIWRMDFSSAAGFKRHELITNATTTVTAYNLRYYKRPRPIVVDTAVPANDVPSELDEIVHRQIVDEAVAIATGVTNPEEYQIKLREAQASE